MKYKEKTYPEYCCPELLTFTPTCSFMTHSCLHAFNIGHVTTKTSCQHFWKTLKNISCLQNKIVARNFLSLESGTFSQSFVVFLDLKCYIHVLGGVRTFWLVSSIWFLQGSSELIQNEHETWMVDAHVLIMYFCYI